MAAKSAPVPEAKVPPLVARVAAIHKKAAAAGKVRHEPPPTGQLRLGDRALEPSAR